MPSRTCLPGLVVGDRRLELDALLIAIDKLDPADRLGVVVAEQQRHGPTDRTHPGRLNHGAVAIEVGGVGDRADAPFRAVADDTRAVRDVEIAAMQRRRWHGGTLGKQKAPRRKPQEPTSSRMSRRMQQRLFGRAYRAASGAWDYVQFPQPAQTDYEQPAAAAQSIWDRG